MTREVGIVLLSTCGVALTATVSRYFRQTNSQQIPPSLAGFAHWLSPSLLLGVWGTSSLVALGCALVLNGSTSAHQPGPTQRTAYYRDVAAVAQTRAELRRIADGRRAEFSPSISYTPQQREMADALEQNLAARVDREEARGGFVRRVIDAITFGQVNAPLRRDIALARTSGALVTQQDLRDLRVTTREGHVLRTEPTTREALWEDVFPAALGLLCWLLVFPVTLTLLRLRGRSLET